MPTKKSACTAANKSKSSRINPSGKLNEETSLHQTVDDIERAYWLKQTPEAFDQYLKATGKKPEASDTFAPLPKLREAKATTQGQQAKATLIGLLQSISDSDYAQALEELQNRWLKGIGLGMERGFNAGWDDGCEKIIGRRKNHNYKIELPSEYEAPMWPGTMKESGTLDFISCILALQVLRKESESKGCKNVVNARNAALDRVQGIALNAGERQGQKIGLSISTLEYAFCDPSSEEIDAAQ